MVENKHEHLDADELLHLALNASQEGKHDAAITLLKRALSLDAQDARLHYLLGAEHAQIGMYDRALDEMQQAVRHDPSLYTAHFQIGLIHITSGRIEPAAAAWQPLDQLGTEHPLYLFKTGLLHLVKDEFEQCASLLRRGIAANQINPALNRDMERILKEAEDRIPNAPNAASAQPAPAAKPRSSDHVLLSAYRKNRGDDKEN